MKPLFLDLFLVFWALVAIRLVSFRSTVSHRTALGYLALGALIGATGILPLHRLVNPYSAGNFPYTPLVTTCLSLLTIFILLLPVFIYLFKRRVYLLLSVGDVFLLAFALGMGFDLLGLLSNEIDAWTKISLVLPWQQETQVAGGSVWLVGTGYRTGLVALALAATLRLVRQRYLPVIVTGLAAVAMAIGTVSWAWPVHVEAEAGLSDSIRGLFSIVSGNGAFTAWVILGLVVLIQILEMKRVSSVGGTQRLSLTSLIRELKELGRSIAAGKLHDYMRIQMRIREIHGLRRQAEIGEFELAFRPNDPTLAQTLPKLKQRLRGLEDGSEVQTSRETLIKVPQPVLLALPWVLVLAMVFWSSGAGRFFSLALVAWLLWWYVTSPTRMGGFKGVDDVVAFYGERSMQTAILAACVLVFFSIVKQPLYPKVATSFALTSPRPTLSLELLVLLIAAGGALAYLARRSRWMGQPWEARKRVTVHRSLAVLSVFLVAWLGVKTYTWAIPKIHEKWGVYIVFIASVDPKVDRPEEMPGWAKALRFNQPGPFGNNLPAWMTGFVVIIGAFLLLWGSRKLIGAVDRALLAEGVSAGTRSRAPPRVIDESPTPQKTESRDG